MEASHSQAPWLTRRAFLGTAAGIVASAYILPPLSPGSPAVPTGQRRILSCGRQSPTQSTVGSYGMAPQVRRRTLISISRAL
jgi:hypothetical protein